MKTKIQIKIKYKKQSQKLFCYVNNPTLTIGHWVYLIDGYNTQVEHQWYHPFEDVNTYHLVPYTPPTYDDYNALIEAMIMEGWIAT